MFPSFLRSRLCSVGFIADIDAVAAGLFKSLDSDGPLNFNSICLDFVMLYLLSFVAVS